MLKCWAFGFSGEGGKTAAKRFEISSFGSAYVSSELVLTRGTPRAASVFG